MRNFKTPYLKTMKGIWNSWDRFWFKSDNLTQISAFRACFAFVLFFAVAMRTPDLKLFYSDQGLLPLSVLPEFFPQMARYTFFQWLSGDFWLWGFHSLLLLSLAAMVVGFYPRFFTVLALILHLSFVHRNMAVNYGLDSVASYYLFYLCFADRVGAKKSSPWGSMAFRLSQIQLCIIYGYSGTKKLQGSSWWSGEALWEVLTNYQIARWDFSWLSSFALPLIFASYFTLVFEMYFPVLIWNKTWRRWLIAFGLMIHLGIGLALNIFFFEALMACLYLLFLTTPEIEKIQAWIRLTVSHWMSGSKLLPGWKKTSKHNLR